ncbi:hypothetical protein P8625_05345 [Tenacibaculum tangerinum]|uniref:PRMT5 arginine-N-methyltransferase domain-containing protein n=1 Tax=Tenacibaculum tangerinum TaxID=3038772 RepID=A0ABY8L595_9FLAO|nr:hypothetical protein [Tenacibaculum tangerinum]WGH76584.1 hypothetical protein P8625_05345 [Tenacibaculum tangerinum]
MNLKKELLRIASVFLEDTTDYLKLSAAIKEYKNMLLQSIESDMEQEDCKSHIYFENGVAIGTKWAMLCIDDMLRTKKFIRGIDMAIKDQMHQKDTLRILYAGTGPFATLLLPLMVKYAEYNIHYDLLEINPLSFKSLKEIIKKLNIETCNITFINDDATKYAIPTNACPDIIVSETMQLALDKEQQVSIFYNLTKQAHPNTVFIPEKIDLFIGTRIKGIDELDTQQKRYQKHHKVFEVSKQAMKSNDWIIDKTSGKLDFAQRHTVLTDKELSTASEIVVMTEITIYKDIQLTLNESGLTIPKYIKDVSENKDKTMTIESQYIIGSEPKLSLKTSSNQLT